MSKLFILGAGFSKAVHPGMPLLNELSQNLNWAQLPLATQAHKRLQGDIEQLLSYLYQEMPWKSPKERHLDMGLFYAISQLIAEFISQREAQAFTQSLPSWATEFVTYLHRMQTTVVTLNYDTVLERLTGMLSRKVLGSRDISASPRVERDIVLDDLYQFPILPLEERTRNPLGRKALPTFRLLKPHGSINWYSLGDDDPNGSQVFYDGVEGFFPDESQSKPMRVSTPDIAGYKALRESNKRDLVPLIIPPVAEKSSFYRSHMVKMLWSEFAGAIENASQIYFVGYSLPKTDLSMRLFLTSLVGDSTKDIYLVNPDSSGALKLNYQEVLSSCNWVDSYLGHGNAVELMVRDLIQEYDQKQKVAYDVAESRQWILKCPNCGNYVISPDDANSREAKLKRIEGDVSHMFKTHDPKISLFEGDSEELLFMIRELDLNRSDLTCKCTCGYYK